MFRGAIRELVCDVFLVVQSEESLTWRVEDEPSPMPPVAERPSLYRGGLLSLISRPEAPICREQLAAAEASAEP